MAMTVRQLRAALAKYPAHYTVATSFDDNGGDEIQWTINSLHELEDGEDKDRLGPTVVLRS